MDKPDVIELSLPFKAEYVSTARLAASGIASRIGFDVETVEDIKVALAEVCNKLVNAGSSAQYYKVVFHVFPERLTTAFSCEDKALRCIFDGETDILAISIINALMDSVEFCPEGEFLLLMTKSVEGNG